MEAISYLDSLVKEYLLFRGFAKTVSALNADCKHDPGLGYQGQQISDHLFNTLIPQHRTEDLVALLKFLQSRIFCKLPEHLASSAGQLETAVLRLFLVVAIQKKKQHRVQELFQSEGDRLLTGDQADTWGLWYGLPCLNNPQQDHRFQVYFTGDWARMVEASFRNFLSEALLHLPLPALLRFDADKRQRMALQVQVSRLQGPHEHLLGHDSAVHAMAYSADGGNLASGDAGGVVRIWAPYRPGRGNAERTAVLLCGAPVTALAWDTRTDKVMLVGTQGKGIKAWHADTKRMVSQVRLDAGAPDVLDLACSPTEPVFACIAGQWEKDRRACGVLSLWNMRTFRKVHSVVLPGGMCLLWWKPWGCLLPAQWHVAGVGGVFPSGPPTPIFNTPSHCHR
ncbi:hypothetical protein WJX73_002583 [Symbiochloris irregularis]|uniref:ARMC9 CTLH-like domain-containing protein n=1 Tax=Symbiochloris irregularis TaxID=706552 RepID=A0AAW1PFX0_9CHLO